MEKFHEYLPLFVYLAGKGLSLKLKGEAYLVAWGAVWYIAVKLGHRRMSMR